MAERAKLGPISIRLATAVLHFKNARKFLLSRKVGPSINEMRLGIGIIYNLRKETLNRGDEVERRILHFFERSKAITKFISENSRDAGPSLISLITEIEEFVEQNPNR